VIAGSWLERVDASRLDVDLVHLETVGAVVAGAAIAEPAGRKPLDLLPLEVVVERKQARAARFIGAGAVVALVALGGLGALRFLQVRKAEQAVGSLQGAITSVKEKIPLYDKVQQQDEAIFADSAIGLPLVSHEVYWPGVLDALAKYTPSSVSATGFSGTATVAPSAVTTAAATGASSAVSPELPAATDTLGTVGLSFTGTQYPSFKRWFDAMVASKRFEIVTYSGVTSSGTGVSFTAQLAITGLIHTDRLSKFELAKP
jgi:Tfp pilus assembly protein PilN